MARGVSIGANAAAAKRSSAWSSVRNVAATALNGKMGSMTSSRLCVTLSLRTLKPEAKRCRAGQESAAVITATKASKVVAAASTRDASSRASRLDCRSRTSTRMGSRAGEIAPANTSPANDGIRNAARYASIESPAPKDRAMRTVLRAPETFTQAVRAPMRAVSDKIPRRISDTGNALQGDGDAAIKFRRGEPLSGCLQVAWKELLRIQAPQSGL